jgi:hypothetical protein
MKTILSVFLIACLSISGCKKDDFEGALFQCKIDGKEFIADKDRISVSVSGGNNYYIQATRLANPLTDDLYGEIKLDIVVDSVGTIQLNASNTWGWRNNDGNDFRSNRSDSGTLSITSLDVKGKRVTGTFELTAYNDNQSSTRSITEGVFDVSW